MGKPHPWFWASLLWKKVRLIHGRLRYILEMSYSSCVSQFLKISLNTVTCTVTGKRENRGGGCEMAKWTPCERKEVSWGCFGQESRKQNRQHRGGSKGITVGKAVVQQQKQELTVLDNNAICFQVFFEWDNDWFSFNLRWLETVSSTFQDFEFDGSL